MDVKEMPEIIKADGTKETFQPQKLMHSLLRAGAQEAQAHHVVEETLKTLTPHARTTDVYRRAFLLLKKTSRPLAARYALRRAMFDLGPTGFPFEDFVVRIFRAEGYEASPRHVVSGVCISHEIDMLAKKGSETIAAELKFHNRVAYKTDVKVALYVHARFLDIKKKSETDGTVCPISSMYLVTNTKFTEQAVIYASCAGISLLGWSFPEGNSLLDRMTRTGVYPITALTSLSIKEKRLLLSKQIVACSDIVSDPSVLSASGIPQEKILRVQKEAGLLCSFTPNK